MMMPAAWQRPTAAEARVPGVAYWSFIGFYLFSLLNGAGVLTLAYRWDSLPIQPMAFALACAMVVPWTRSKPTYLYFRVAWIYWLMFTVVGALGPARQASLLEYGMIQLVLKMWISIVGIPYLALRAINRDKLPFFTQLTAAACAAGALLSVAFVFVRGPWDRFASDPGRASGPWVNPNGLAEVCAFALFASFLFPFRSWMMNLAVRGALIVGMLGSLSRSAIVLLVVGFVVYGLAMKRVKTVLQVGAILVVMFIAGNVLIDFVSSKGLVSDTRLERIGGVLRGDLSSKVQGDRMQLWSKAFSALSRDWIVGLGHRSMDHIVDIPGRAAGSGLAPHNYFIYIWGNSGLPALLAFIAYLVALYRIGARSVDPRARAVLYAMTSMLVVIAMVNHAFLNNQYFGPIFALMAVVGYYAQPAKQPAPMMWRRAPA